MLDLAARLRRDARIRGWSVAELAARSSVSKAMIGKVERGESSPTAALLGKLSAAFGLSMSALLARAEADQSRLRRAAEQAEWRDPATGYRRRQLSPPGAEAIELVEVELPAGASVPFPAGAFRFIRQAIWVLDGVLSFTEGSVEHRLATGDCLTLGPPQDCTFHNRSSRPCRYLVAVTGR